MICGELIVEESVVEEYEGVVVEGGMYSKKKDGKEVVEG